MNERILELINQSTKVYPPDWNTVESLEEFDIEKFTRLIILECAKICADTAVESPPNDLLEGYNMGVNKAAENIKKHFGVEE